jgi:hypothetical protein
MTAIPQLQQKLGERVLERAEADPQWKRQYIEDSQTAVSDMPEAQSLREIAENVRPTEVPPEATVVPLTEEYQQLRKSLTHKILDKAASDPRWKQQLLDDPEAAMRQADLPESRQLQQANERVLASVQQDEVRSQEAGDTWGPIYHCEPSCEVLTTFWWPNCYYKKAYS